MSTLYGLNAQKRLVDEPSQKINVNEQGGRMRVAYDEITVDANLAIGDKIVLGKIPAGAKVYNGLWNIIASFGSTGVADIGWEASAEGGEVADPDGFMFGLSLTTAGADNQFQFENQPGLYKKFDEAVDVIATITTATDGAAGKLALAVMYSLD